MSYIIISKEETPICLSRYSEDAHESINSIKEKCDPKNSTNSPFYVDVNMVLNYVNTIFL